jgi:hypothetical protein
MKRTASILGVTCDEPGTRLFLDREPAPPVPDIIAAVILGFGTVFLIAPAGEIFTVFRGTSDFPWPLLAIGSTMTVLMALGFVSIAWSLVRDTILVHQLHADGVTSELRVARKGLFGLLGGTSRIPSGRIERLRVGNDVQTTRGLTFKLDDGKMTVHLSVWTAGGRPRRKPDVDVVFCVAALDKREEVLDLALRLGAACNFGTYRVTRSDVRDIEVEMDRSTPGGEAIPALKPADYVRDHVAPEAKAAAAQEKTPHFDPAAFVSDFRVDEWTPGERVLFRKPFGWLGPLGCLPFVAAPLGLAVACLVRWVSHQRTDEIVGAGFFLAVGAVPLLLFYLILRSAWPRQATLDWRTRRMTVSGVPPLALSALRAVELRGVKIYHTPSRSRPYWTYHCDVLVDHDHPVHGVPTSTVIVSTQRFVDDSATPWRMGVPLVTDLAQALGIEKRLTDYVSLPRSGLQNPINQ